ncbi:hypothetical protein E2320_017871 [Naja naja]|nr:hypothetical protein E2320_017871 [Naja naja]
MILGQVFFFFSSSSSSPSPSFCPKTSSYFSFEFPPREKHKYFPLDASAVSVGYINSLYRLDVIVHSNQMTVCLCSSGPEFEKYAFVYLYKEALFFKKKNLIVFYKPGAEK